MDSSFLGFYDPMTDPGQGTAASIELFFFSGIFVNEFSRRHASVAPDDLIDVASPTMSP